MKVLNSIPYDMGCSISTLPESSETSALASRTATPAKELPVRKLYQLKEVNEEAFESEEDEPTNKDNNTNAFPLLTGLEETASSNAPPEKSSSRPQSVTSVQSGEQRSKTPPPGDSPQSKNSSTKSKDDGISTAKTLSLNSDFPENSSPAPSLKSCQSARPEDSKITNLSMSQTVLLSTETDVDCLVPKERIDGSELSESSSRTFVIIDIKDATSREDESIVKPDSSNIQTVEQQINPAAAEFSMSLIEKDDLTVEEISFPTDENKNDKKEINFQDAQRDKVDAHNEPDESHGSGEEKNDAERQNNYLNGQIDDTKSIENAVSKSPEHHNLFGLENSDGKFHPKIVDGLINEVDLNEQTDNKSDHHENISERDGLKSSLRRVLNGLTDPRIDGKFHPKLVEGPRPERELKYAVDYQNIINFPTRDDFQTESETLFQEPETYKESSGNQFSNLSNFAQASEREDKRSPPNKQQTDYLRIYENIANNNLEDVSFSDLLNDCDSINDLPCSLAASSSGLIMPRPLTSKKKSRALKESPALLNHFQQVITNHNESDDENGFKSDGQMHPESEENSADEKDEIKNGCENNDSLTFNDISYSAVKDDLSLSKENESIKNSFNICESPEIRLQPNSSLTDGTLNESIKSAINSNDTSSLNELTSKISDIQNEKEDLHEVNDDELRHTFREEKDEVQKESPVLEKNNSKVHAKVIRFNLPDPQEPNDEQKQEVSDSILSEEQGINRIHVLRTKPMESSHSDAESFRDQPAKSFEENHQQFDVSQQEDNDSIINKEMQETPCEDGQGTIPNTDCELKETIPPYEIKVSPRSNLETEESGQKVNCETEKSGRNCEETRSLENNNYINYKMAEIIPKENASERQISSAIKKKNDRVFGRVSYCLEKIAPEENTYAKKIISPANSASNVLLNV